MHPEPRRMPIVFLANVVPAQMPAGSFWKTSDSSYFSRLTKPSTTTAILACFSIQCSRGFSPYRLAKFFPARLKEDQLNQCVSIHGYQYILNQPVALRAFFLLALLARCLGFLSVRVPLPFAFLCPAGAASFSEPIISSISRSV